MHQPCQHLPALVPAMEAMFVCCLYHSDTTSMMPCDGFTGPVTGSSSSDLSAWNQARQVQDLYPFRGRHHDHMHSAHF